jgi:hypothetical protein
MIDLAAGRDTAGVVQAAAEQGVLVVAWSRTRIRAVFHLDTDDAATRRAGQVLAGVLAARG